MHAYERTEPVYKYQKNNCGPVYITAGDGGNIEGLYRQEAAAGGGWGPWSGSQPPPPAPRPPPPTLAPPRPHPPPSNPNSPRRNFVYDTVGKATSMCVNNGTGFTLPRYQPTPDGVALNTYQNGTFCPSSQPDWSAFAQPIYGHGARGWGAVGVGRRRGGA